MANHSKTRGEHHKPTSSARKRATGKVINRLAYRELSSHKRRSLLIVLLVMIPVAIESGLGTFLQSALDHPGKEYGQASSYVVPIQLWDGSCAPKDTGTSYACIDDPKLPSKQLHHLAEKQQEALTQLSIPGHKLYPLYSGNTTFIYGDSTLEATVKAGDIQKFMLAHAAVPSGRYPSERQVWISARSARDFNLSVGSKINLDGSKYTISNLVYDQESGLAMTIYVGPNHPLKAKTALIAVGMSGPDPTISEVKTLNHNGLAPMIKTREIAAYQNTQNYANNVAGMTLIALIASLATATIAWSAFAIGARQQERSIALLAITGANRRTIKATFIRQGLLLGLIASVLGIIFGVGGALSVIGIYNYYSIIPPLPMQIDPLMSMIAFALGIFTATFAAWIPARTICRQDALTAVRNYETPTPKARFPRLGAATLAIGIAVIIAGYFINLEPVDDAGKVFKPAFNSYAIFIYLGMALLYLGALLSMGWLLDRLARGLPISTLSWRFALRDLSRNRGRGVAAVCSAMALMTLFSALVLPISSLIQREIDRYQADLPANMGYISGPINQHGTSLAINPANFQKIESVVNQVMGNKQAFITLKQVHFCAVQSDECHSFDTAKLVYKTRGQSAYRTAPLVIDDDGSVYQFYTGRTPDSTFFSTLTTTPIVFNKKGLDQGKVHFSFGDFRVENTQDTVYPVKVVDTGLPGIALPTIASSKWMAEKMGLTENKLEIAPISIAVKFTTPPTDAQISAIQRDLLPYTGATNSLRVNVGAPISESLITIVTTAAAGLMALVSFVVLGLTLADSRGSRAAVAGVGARKATLKNIAAVQSVVAILLGNFVGLIVGIIPVCILILSTDEFPLTIPWGHLAAVTLGVPLFIYLLVRLLVPAAKAQAMKLD